jgi:Gluconate 2-dehydrogenase subunit 3
MSERKPMKLSRRAAMSSGAAALAALLVDPRWIAEARAQGTVLRADPRHDLADRLCDLVIPATDTPGASAAGVAAFLLLVLDREMSDLTPGMLTTVTAVLNGDAGGEFLKVPVERQAQLLGAFDQRAYLGGRPSLDSPEYAWRRMKAAIVAGYYTSEIGASKELVYEPVPGGFRSFKLTPDFRVRSNDALGGVL